MSEEMVPPKEAVEILAKDEAKQTRRVQTSLQDLVDALRSVQDDIGQISELTLEEKALVAEFFNSLSKLMQPLAASIQVSTAVVAKDDEDVIQANIDPTGHLAIVYRDGQLELTDLSDYGNRELMIKVVEDIVPKFKQLTNARRHKLENRMKLLSSLTKEMQKISKALSTVSTPS
jgi:DNA-binding protein H-NS